jgi:hypothetical protein
MKCNVGTRFNMLSSFSDTKENIGHERPSAHKKQVSHRASGPARNDIL